MTQEAWLIVVMAVMFIPAAAVSLWAKFTLLSMTYYPNGCPVLPESDD